MKRIIFTVLCIAALSGCGLKGDLYLPNNSPVAAPVTQTATDMPQK